MKHRIPFHPALLPVFPVLTFWLVNKDFVPFQSIWRILVICLAGTLLLYALSARLLKSLEKGAMLASLIAVGLLYFGQTYFSLNADFPHYLLPHIYFIIWILLFLTGAFLIIRMQKPHPSLTHFLNLLSVLLLAAPLYATFRALGEYQIPRPTIDNDMAIYFSSQPKAVQHPDIYYIILDAYGRGDVLSDLYALDNSDFLDSLRRRGFYVADKSRANYIQTHLALSTALTGNYLDPSQFDPASTNRVITEAYLDESPDLKYLRQLGYEIVSTRDVLDFLDLELSDRFLATRAYFNSFELGFNQMTLNSIWAYDLYGYKLWQFTRAQLDSMESPSLDSGPPHFVFAHIFSPHPPFSFDSQGNYVSTFQVQTGAANLPADEIAAYIAGYRTQVQYLNSRISRIIDHILQNPQRPAIIILQADHGPGAYLDTGSAANTCLRERFSILNAYYFPDKSTRARLYPSLSPVNSFRLILGELVGKPVPLLEDRSYFSTWERPYDFLDVTSSVDTCSPLKR